MILKLTLKKTWFDLIRNGNKTEEYREIKAYWANRLYAISPINAYEFENTEDTADAILNGYSPKCPFRSFTHVQFTNGYSPTSPTFTIECKGIRIGRGNPEWGAPTDKDVFILELGKIVQL